MTKFNDKMLLFRFDTIRREVKHRSIEDQRRKVNYVLVSYRGEDGCEYRKSFESYSEPTIPNQGTHREINALAIQY